MNFQLIQFLATAEHGDTSTLYLILESFLEAGINVPKDDKKAFECYMKSAQNGKSYRSSSCWGTNCYDGVPGQMQCPIPNNTTLIYNFTVPDQSGTFCSNHSHHLAQYVDGVLGAIIVKDPDDPYQNDYDEEVVILLSDWYHNETFTLLNYYLSLASKGLEPQPDNGLINGRNNYNCKWAPVSYKCIDNAGLSKFNFVPEKRYRLRVIILVKKFYNLYSALLSFTFSIDEHAMDVIEVEGMMTKRHTIHRLIINVAQRYSVIVTADKLVSNFWMKQIYKLNVIMQLN
ncbi:multicopper oxidase [Gigaspora margarita]|uniref:Multicopper oxidase n=1 Tax=Gigaspora margarita TaxID=4874 RepID=A0A8H4ETE5_GIGMA|nr:multicopper oxidase [Gigaspora margarita]